MKVYRIGLRIGIFGFMVLSFIFVTVPHSEAQATYPSKPVTIVVGFGAGGGTDLAFRALVPTMERIFKQPVVIANKPGASTAIGLEFVKNSLPDGYTLGSFTSSGCIGSLLRPVPYHWINDFTHIAQFITPCIGIAVQEGSPWKTLKDLLDYGHKNPGKLRFGSLTVGGAAQMIGDNFAALNDLKWTLVPFDSDVTTATGLLGGHVDVMTSSPAGWGPFAKAGKFRVLMVFTEERLKEFQNVPCAKELNQYIPHWQLYGILGPRNLPKNVVQMVSSAVKTATKDPDFKKLMDEQSNVITFKEGEEYLSSLKKIDEEVAGILKRSGLKVVREAYK